MVGLDRKLMLAILLNAVIALALVVIPLIPRDREFSVLVEPEHVPLNGNFTIQIDFKKIPDSFTLRITEGPSEQVVSRRDFAEVVSNHVEVRLSAEEGKYGIGLHLAKAEAKYGPKTVEKVTPFSITTGGNLTVYAEVAPSLIETIGNESGQARVMVRVLNEMGEPCSNATVWFSVRTEFVNLSPNPATTDGDGEAEAAIVASAGNYTDVIELVVAKRGHPISIKSIEIEVVQKPS